MSFFFGLFGCGRSLVPAARQVVGSVQQLKEKHESPSTFANLGQNGVIPENGTQPGTQLGTLKIIHFRTFFILNGGFLSI